MGEVVNRLPGDVRYQWTTLDGQRERARGKRPPKHPYVQFAIDNHALELLSPTAIHPQLQSLPHALPPPPALPAWEIEGVPDPRAMFGNERTFTFCQLMVQARLPRAHMDACIMNQHSKTVGSEEALLVRSTTEVLDKYSSVADELGLKFTATYYYIEEVDRTVVLHTRPADKLARWLYLRPGTWGKVVMQPAPRHVQRPDGSNMRVDEGFASGKWMEEVRPKLPDNAQVLAILEAYDKTHLDLQGNQKAYGHYWVLNGLHAADKQRMDNWWTYGLRPIIMTNKNMKREHRDALTDANATLRHAVNKHNVEAWTPLATEGIIITAWDGQHPRHVFPIVSNTIVDREDAYAATEIRGSSKGKRNCTDCLAKTSDFNNGRVRAAKRTVEHERARVQAAELILERRDNGGAEAERLLYNYGSHLRHNALWDLPHYGMERHGVYSAVCFAQVHTYHTGQYKKVVTLIYKDLLELVYGNEDAAQWRQLIMAHIREHGVGFPTITESFVNGWDEAFTGWDTKHWAALSRCLRCALEGVFADGAALEVLGRLMEWYGIAKLEVQTDDTLWLCQNQLWPEYCDRRNALLGPLDGNTNFNNDKSHQCAHLQDKIRNFGIIDGQSDEGSETAHKANLKENWRSRNNRRPLDQQQQIANNLELFDTCRALQEMYKHHLERDARAGGACHIHPLCSV
jgi:hypothetical protein